MSRKKSNTSWHSLRTMVVNASGVAQGVVDIADSVLSPAETTRGDKIGYVGFRGKGFVIQGQCTDQPAQKGLSVSTKTRDAIQVTRRAAKNRDGVSDQSSPPGLVVTKKTRDTLNMARKKYARREDAVQSSRTASRGTVYRLRVTRKDQA